jgi:hypothetical protein
MIPGPGAALDTRLLLWHDGNIVDFILNTPLLPSEAP